MSCGVSGDGGLVVGIRRGNSESVGVFGLGQIFWKKIWKLPLTDWERIRYLSARSST